MHPILRFYPPHTIQQPTHHIVIPQKYRALSDILARKKKENWALLLDFLEPTNLKAQFVSGKTLTSQLVFLSL